MLKSAGAQPFELRVRAEREGARSYDEVLVEAERGPANFLERNGFYERAITGRGVLMLREDIESFAINTVTDVMRRIPLLDIDESRPLSGPQAFRNPEIRVLRNGQYCSPTLYIDRHIVNSGNLGSVRPDDYVSVAEIEAIEVYGLKVAVIPNGKASAQIGEERCTEVFHLAHIRDVEVAVDLQK